MNKSTLRLAVIVLTVITALIHLFLGVISLTGGDMMFGVLFLLNGIGYLVLMAGVVTDSVPILSDNKPLAHYALIAFALVTIIAYLVINGFDFGAMGIISKVDELLLIIATWLHLNASE